MNHVTRCVAIWIGALLVGLPSTSPGADQTPPRGKPAAAQKTDVDISGTWSLVATFLDPEGKPRGGFPATLTLKQRGTTLEGYFAPPAGGGPFTGTVKGKTVAFVASFPHPDLAGVRDTVDITGTVEDAKTIKGRVKSQSKGPGTDAGAAGTFVATRR